MNYFPITCIDDFYSNPNEVREFALSQKFYHARDNFPGKRTDRLDLISESFFNSFCERLFSIFFEFKREDIAWTISTYFQKIEPFDTNQKSPLNEGWVHNDGSKVIAAGVVYLNPLTNGDAGTSFYSSIVDSPTENITLRDKFYGNQNVDIEEYISEKENNNSQYKQTLEIKNVYNRMAFFGAQYPHKESNFHVGYNEPRLTQPFFINVVNCISPPLIRKNRYEIKYD